MHADAGDLGLPDEFKDSSGGGDKRTTTDEDDWKDVSSDENDNDELGRLDRQISSLTQGGRKETVVPAVPRP